ncbi:MAG: VCBS repeat-containing protein [Planctomycetes bacterium]|jgi:hypothetical protein|nr:VCBS repeat-containing protein [Planctomycetota bacterium]
MNATRPWLSLLLGTAAVAQQPPALPTHEPTAAIAGEALVDTDGDGRAELICITAEGSIRRQRFVDGAFVTDGELQLRDPTHSLLAFADLDPAPGIELVALDGSGAAWLRWPVDGMAIAPTTLSRRARCQLPLGRPQLSPFVQDLDRDGRLDLLVPQLQGVLPFVQEAPAADDAPVFRALELLPVQTQVELDDVTRGSDQERIGALVVPRIETQDLDGDGRPDLLFRDDLVHTFHLQGGDGKFARRVSVDLRQFEDSTPKAAVAPGSTLVLGDRQQLQRGDIDGDGIPDFVIAHRRKVWTFLGGKQGPQFTKARTQAVADDVSAMLLVDLEDDQKADLLTFQVQVPGVGALLLGLVQSIDLDIKAVGYRSENSAFANTPAWRRTITLRIPPLLSLLSRQEELLQRLTTVVGKARIGERGAFTAAGRSDLWLVRGDGKALDLYALDGQAPSLASASGRRLLRRVLFDDPDPVFDLERVFTLLGGFLDELSGGLIGDRQPVASAPLRDAAAWRPVELLVGDVDGDRRDDLVVVSERVPGASARASELPQRAYELVRAPAAK